MTESQLIPDDEKLEGDAVFQAQYIPKQKRPPVSDHASMKAFISTFPALGQVSQLARSNCSKDVGHSLILGQLIFHKHNRSSY